MTRGRRPSPAGDGPAGRYRAGLRGWALTGVAGLAALAVLHVWQPSADARFAFCLLRRFAGLPCPGCGLTRAFAHLAKGEWTAALRDHPLAPLFAAEAALAWAAWGGAVAGLLRLPRPSRPELAAIGHLALLVTVWLGRMATGTLPW